MKLLFLNFIFLIKKELNLGDNFDSLKKELILGDIS